MMGRYCGTYAPPPMYTTANLIWIRFVSDGLNEGEGVKGSLKAITCKFSKSKFTVKISMIT